MHLSHPWFLAGGDCLYGFPRQPDRSTQDYTSGWAERISGQTIELPALGQTSGTRG
jgi:hypothetical protein